MIRAVLFDMDGLMFDTERLIAGIWDRIGEEHGFGRLSSVMAETMGMRSGVREIFLHHFGENFPYGWFREEYRRRMDDEIRKNGLPVKPGLYLLLGWLKRRGNFRLAVASSTSRAHVVQYCATARVTEYFDALVCGDMVSRGKPDPEIYLTAAQKIGVPPREALVLEDSPNGCFAGLCAGANVVMVPDRVQPDKALRPRLAAVAGSLAEVIPLLERAEGGLVG